MSLAGENDRREIAALAARLIADSGLDYRSAKARAVRELFGTRPPRGAVPDNDLVDEALREHLELFDQEHPARVKRLREVALDLMDKLAQFRPLVTGAAWKGIVAEHAPLHLQVFHENPKEVQYWLLDRNIRFEVDLIEHFRARDQVEALMFEWRGESVLLSVYGYDDLRGALKPGASGAQRGDREALEKKMQERR
ncbi:MAG: UDP-N-acetylmuramate--alanine ligase [Quisquiliibacterium sp.]